MKPSFLLSLILFTTVPMLTSVDAHAAGTTIRVSSLGFRPSSRKTATFLAGGRFTVRRAADDAAVQQNGTQWIDSTDDENDYMTNESAINYNAGLVYAFAALLGPDPAKRRATAASSRWSTGARPRVPRPWTAASTRPASTTPTPRRRRSAGWAVREAAAAPSVRIDPRCPARSWRSRSCSSGPEPAVDRRPGPRSARGSRSVHARPAPRAQSGVHLVTVPLFFCGITRSGGHLRRGSSKIKYRTARFR
ncbi:MAG TPA: hypothetical protein VKZ18_07040 [Polyangia bacterium]|nr:hypothetical protein [Polyangia bacterium]